MREIIETQMLRRILAAIEEEPRETPGTSRYEREEARRCNRHGDPMRWIRAVGGTQTLDGPPGRLETPGASRWPHSK